MLPRPRILVVDADPSLLGLTRRGLTLAGYDVALAGTGQEGLTLARDLAPDFVILDLALPDLDGLEISRRLRAADRELPILLLTGQGLVAERIAGLDAGADDCLAIPFDFDELLARIRALLRRTFSSMAQPQRFADLSLDPATREVRRGHRRIVLTTREYEILAFFLRHPRQVLSREFIFESVWTSSFLDSSNVVDVHVRRLRAKTEAAGEPRLIQTVRGAGYALREEQAPA